MKFLYAPWRQDYIENNDPGKQEDAAGKECVFCKHYAAQDDENSFILKRFNHFYVILNAFPYNPGHIMLVSARHVASLTDLTRQERAELIELTSATIDILQKELGCDGFNVGINSGKAAGAGIPSHFHQHIIPRWYGDTNFLPTVAETKHVSADLMKLYKRLKAYYKD